MGVACCHPAWSGIDLIVICLKLDISGVTDCSALPPVILWSFLYVTEPSPSQEWGNWSQLKADCA